MGEKAQAETNSDAELETIVQYYKGFKDQFKLFQEQILEGNFAQVDAWAAALVEGRRPPLSLLKEPELATITEVAE